MIIIKNKRQRICTSTCSRIGWTTRSNHKMIVKIC